MKSEDLQHASQLIAKDFDLVVANHDKERDLAALRKWLAGEITLLIDCDFQKLLNILYRIDVSEQKTRLALSDDDPAFALAGLIIDRELQKVETRKKYKM